MKKNYDEIQKELNQYLLLEQKLASLKKEKEEKKEEEKKEENNEGAIEKNE